jgi:hypothetical protein
MNSNKETKETLIGILTLARLLAEEFKDGAQVTDVAVVLAKISASEELKTKMLEAYNGIENVPSEVRDLTVYESLDLLATAIPEFVSLVGAIKK